MVIEAYLDIAGVVATVILLPNDNQKKYFHRSQRFSVLKLNSLCVGGVGTLAVVMSCPIYFTRLY